MLRRNAVFNGERQRALSAALGAPERPARELMADLIRLLGQPGTLREVGLHEDQLADLAQRALVYPPVQANPQPIRGADDVREILALAW